MTGIGPLLLQHAQGIAALRRSCFWLWVYAFPTDGGTLSFRLFSRLSISLIAFASLTQES